jgi:hypothetical protein
MLDNIFEMVQILKAPKSFFLFLSSTKTIIIIEMKERGGGWKGS